MRGVMHLRHGRIEMLWRWRQLREHSVCHGLPGTTNAAMRALPNVNALPGHRREIGRITPQACSGWCRCWRDDFTMVLAALGASVAIVAAEAAGATVTVSASLVAEAAHLW